MDELKRIKSDFSAGLERAEGADDLEKIRVKYLGRKSELTAILRSLKDKSVEEKRKLGPAAQALKREMEAALSKKLISTTAYRLPPTRIDLTAPGKKLGRGHLHPLTLVDREIRRIFSAMNFSVVDGPEIESEHYNFDALNIPPNHPARDAWDTFWLKTQNYAERTQTNAEKFPRKSASSPRQSALLLRTHTSPVQIRYMEAHNPPFQIIVPGRAFRYEAIDASHEINFHQLEGLMVGKNISLANFKFVVEEFFGRFFAGKSASRRIEFRYRPSYFPFVEPGLEVDVKFGGKWLEMMGAGMVHPRVFECAHYNPRDWQGFAFGVGIDRLAMIKYGIPDIRLFYSGDLRLVKQF
jgi:phenylalanyl-tRNA synthetase alpha chain